MNGKASSCSGETMGETVLRGKIKFYLSNVQLEMLITHLMEMSNRRQDMFLKSGVQGQCQGWRICRSGSF